MEGIQMQSIILTERVNMDTRIVTVKFEEGESYRIQLGVWCRLQQTLKRAVLSIARNERVSAHQHDTPAMNCVEDGGKQSCQAVIL
jgi:hypothetical protein